MDDDTAYGDCFHQLTFAKDIDAGIVSDYQIITVSQIKASVAENRLILDESNPQDNEEAQMLAAGIALKRSYKEHMIKPAISFHRSIRRRINSVINKIS